jgi:hypothetical protein
MSHHRQILPIDLAIERIRRRIGERAPCPEVLEELLGCLFEIAKADGHVRQEELVFLGNVARIFGFGDADFARIRATHLGPDPNDPYTVLGVPHEATFEDVRAACGEDFCLVVPGIRPAGSNGHDQMRILTPAEAIDKGADYLVVGRPLAEAPAPVGGARAILRDIR